MSFLNWYKNNNDELDKMYEVMVRDKEHVKECLIFSSFIQNIVIQDFLKVSPIFINNGRVFANKDIKHGTLLTLFPNEYTKFPNNDTAFITEQLVSTVGTSDPTVVLTHVWKYRTGIEGKFIIGSSPKLIDDLTKVGHIIKKDKENDKINSEIFYPFEKVKKIDRVVLIGVISTKDIKKGEEILIV